MKRPRERRIDGTTILPFPSTMKLPIQARSVASGLTQEPTEGWVVASDLAQAECLVRCRRKGGAFQSVCERLCVAVRTN